MPKPGVLPFGELAGPRLNPLDRVGQCESSGQVVNEFSVAERLTGGVAERLRLVQQRPHFVEPAGG